MNAVETFLASVAMIGVLTATTALGVLAAKAVVTVQGWFGCDD